MTACACLGPPGNCPCIRAGRGEKLPINEIFIAPSLFALLPEEDQNTINDLKLKALGLLLTKRDQE